MSSCVECGSWSSKTLETRKDTRYGFVWRRKKCQECGSVWSTYEIPASAVEAEIVNPDGRLERR